MKLPYERRKSLIGLLCVSPWIIGFLCLYLYPLVQSVHYSLSDLTFQAGTLNVRFVGWENYKTAFLSDPVFVRILTATLKDMLYQVPIILIYSMIVALLLNHKFRGRAVMRSIFFLPVIIATGVVMNIMKTDTVSMLMMSDAGSSSMFKADMFQTMLQETGVESSVVNAVIDAANNIFDLSWRSGIQILLFLAGLQSVPRPLYEASAMDGCTAWERYWKVTFPIMTPILMINLIYTIVDHFTSFDNAVMQSIMEYSSQLKYAYSSTLAWIYFAAIIGILLLAAFLMRRRMSYLDL